jgi:beta-aspartyl-peptidase (threonine type)
LVFRKTWSVADFAFVMRKIAIAIHGGAGVIGRMPAARQALYLAGLKRALDSGHEILEQGGSSLDAVSAAVVALEDDPLFNAGRGAVYNLAGKHELDASIMDGATLRAGAVAAVSRIKNPVLAARAVMEQSPHVLLAGKGAEDFARRQGLSFVSAKYFHTAARLAALRKGSKGHHGTVGAVALDQHGNLAAATSTGGYTGKLAGRVGDSPIVGAGTYADNASCAVSGTGWGEAFIRVALAHEVSARMRHLDETLAKAARAALKAVARIGGDGGLVALDRRGTIAMPFTSEGMFRACIRADGRRLVKIHR